MSRLTSLAVAVLSAAFLAACSGDDPPPETLISGDTLTVYSSLPLHGPLGPVARDVVRAEKLALAEAGGQAGDFKINYVSLNASNPKTGRWDAALVAANARRAVSDRQTIAYLGELESGASAISVPLVNSAGILQVSPMDTFGGLTAPGGRGEPEKYYPSGRRTFTRVVGGDDAQAAELAGLIARERPGRVVIADDRQLAGTSLADRVADLLEADGITVADRWQLDASDEVPEDIAERLEEEPADAFLYTGAHGRFGVQVLRAVHAAASDVPLFASDDLALTPGMTRAAAPIGDSLTVTAIVPPAGADAQAFARLFQRTYGHEPAPEALLGYEAMRRVVAAVDGAGDRASSRRAVISQALHVQATPPAGFAPYEVRNDRLVRIRTDM